MADNVGITTGVDATVATDDVSGIHYQKVKPVFGGSDSVTQVEPTEGFPVRLANPTAQKLSSAAINENTSGDKTILAGTANQTIRCFRLMLQADGEVVIIFKDGAGGTAYNGAGYRLYKGGSIVLDFDGEPHFVTSSGNGLVMNLSAAVQVSGRFSYTKS